MSCRCLLRFPNQPAPYWREARQALEQGDTLLAPLIRTIPGALLYPRHHPFWTLSRSIVGQQLSTHAAAAQWKRLLAHTGTFTPAAVAQKSIDELRTHGLSSRKSQCLIVLAQQFLDGTLSGRNWHNMDDEAIVATLTQIKGIGRWTAEMFLIFHLLRPDVLPLSDVGIRRAISRLLRQAQHPTCSEITSLAHQWRPWRTVASWYLWRSLDAVPCVKPN